MSDEKQMMEVTGDDPRIGSTLNDRYRIIDKIAAGGMAVVYRGERLELGRPVAIKFLQEVMLQNPKFITRFESEARAMSKLSHPYCVSVIDFGVEGAPYIVMDYVEGETLKALLQKERVSVARAITLTRQILAGIAHAHSHGIVHRDIKPENIMLQEAVGVGEQVRIFDFGLAKMMDQGPGVSLEHSSLVAGTPNYMSPEQSRGGKIDERTDLYSICVVFFEMLTGRKPFIHDDFLEVVRMHRETKPPSINDVSEVLSFSDELQALVAKAMSKDPQARFQTAEAFSAALDATPEGVRAKELEAAIRPDPKAKTLPVGTMTPFEPLEQLERYGKRESVAPTTTLRPEGLDAEASAGDPPQATPIPSTPELERERSRPFPTTTRGWAAFFGGAALLAFVVAFLALPGADDSAGDGSAPKTESHATPSETDGVTAGKTASPSKASAAGDEDSADNTHSRATTVTEGSATRSASETVPEPAFQVKTVTDAKQLIKDGETDAAIAGLQKLRREQPKNAIIVFMLANVYYERAWLSDALDHYREAIRLDDSYRKRGSLIRNLIDMFKIEKLGKKAMGVVHRNVGRPALPLLRRTAKRDKNPLVKRRAAIVIKKIKGK